MLNQTVLRLIVFVIVLSPLGKSQSVPSTPESPGPSSSRFPAMFLKTHSVFTQSAMRPAWEMKSGGELIVGEGSVEFHDPNDAKVSFSFPIADLAALENRPGPEGFRVLRIKLRSGKHFDLVPDVFGKSSVSPGESEKNALRTKMDESVNAMVKAIKDMATRNKVDLKG